MTETFESAGAVVTWQDPNSELRDMTDFSQYDKILVGIASPLALGASNAYGALSLISQLWGDSRLTLFIDAPDPNTITRGLDSIARNPQTITKPFFQTRKDYEFATGPRGKSRVLDACEKLRTEKWPTTIVPGHPWQDEYDYEAELPVGALEQVRMLNFDKRILARFRDPESNSIPLLREKRWMAEKTADRKWLKGLNVSQPIITMRANYRIDQHSYMADRLGSATGYLHAPVRRRSVWWSPKVAIALSQRTPVFTDWTNSQVLGGEWAVIPSTFEAFRESSQHELAQAQYDSYAGCIPSGGKAKFNLLKALDLEVPANV